MRNALAAPAVNDESLKIDAAIQEVFASIEQIDSRIRDDQKDIDRLKAETKAMLTQLRMR